MRLDRGEVSGRLGVDELAEGVGPTRDRPVDRMVRGELEEPAAGRAALVELAGRVEESRPVAGRRRSPGPVAQRRADPGDRRIRLGRWGDERLQAEVRVVAPARELGGQRLDDVGRAGRRAVASPWTVRPSPVAIGAGAGAAAASERPWRASTFRVSSLASSTLGWSNGSMPRTAPAIAVATSQRTNSAPRSIGSFTVIRMTGCPASARAVASAVRDPAVPSVSAIRTKARSGP